MPAIRLVPGFVKLRPKGPPTMQARGSYSTDRRATNDDECHRSATAPTSGRYNDGNDDRACTHYQQEDLPLAGALFLNQRDRTTREEIIIMLTPHVIKDDHAYAKLSEEEMKKAEKFRVGVRKGMMPWGRERLAEGEYDKALLELNKSNPNNQKVLWHLDCATNLNPKFLEAIDLKQKITGREVTSVDNSGARDFVSRMILEELSSSNDVIRFPR